MFTFHHFLNLKNQNQSLKSELEQVSSQLQNEIDQNNERKKKLKGNYVWKISFEGFVN